MASVTSTFQYGIHADRPTSGLAYGALYACSTHNLIYQTTDGGGTWVTWSDPGASTDAELAAIAGLTSAANKVPYFTGSGTAALADLTAAGRALIDDAAASNQATTLGLGTGDSPQFTAVNVGHATDTTITRVSAGVIAVEGATVHAGNLTGDVTSSGLATTIGAGKVTEAMQVLADNATGNASTSAHGYLKKLDNIATNFMNGQGNWAAPGAASAVTFHGAHVYNSAAQTASPLLFDTEVFDTDGYHSTVSNTGRMTIPTSGDGYFEFIFTSLSSPGTDVFTFEKNGTTQITGRVYNLANGYYVAVSHPVHLVATDYVQATNGGGSWGHASVFNAQSQFSIKLLGT